MYSVIIAFGVASVMLCMGLILRAKLKFFQKMLMPVCVIGGIMGFILMNLVMPHFKAGFTVKDFSNIVDVFFVFSFISIGLTGSKKKKKKTEEKSSNGVIRGAMGMALVWCILYAIQPLVGIGITSVLGKAVNMDAMYGILIPFAFCQGPGQASTYGRIFQNVYGYKNAEMVALTFAVFGFIAAFAIGVPIAKIGLKKGLGKSKTKINDAVERGYFVPEEQRESIGKSTTHSANVESIAIHFALMGICYLIALGLAKIISFFPLLGPTFAAMLFFWGMMAAYIVKAVMRKFNCEYLINNVFQARITGFLSDYLVVCAFMAIQVGMIGKWIIPIIVVSVVDAVLTAVICLYFSARFGSDHDFERFLGLYGTSTGTTPSGVSLLRMVDPRLQTPTGGELGMMNMGMMFSTATMIFITLAGLKTLTLPVACIGMALSVIVYLILLKVFRVWKKPTFSLTKGRIHADGEEDDDSTFLRGFLNDPTVGSSIPLEDALNGSVK